jgi:hypothetical protein
LSRLQARSHTEPLIVFALSLWFNGNPLLAGRCL